MRQLIEELGAPDALLYMAARVLDRLTFGRARLVKYHLTAQPVPEGDLTPPRRGRQITVTEASWDEILALPAERPQSVLETRLKHGSRCLVARHGIRVAGFQWFTLESYPEDEVRCVFELRPEDRCAWDFDIYVLPEWRLQPVFTRLWDDCHRILREAGIRTSLSRINAFNAVSRRAHERIGAEVIGWAVFLRIGSAQLAAFSGRPWLHASLTRGVPTWPVSRMATVHSAAGAPKTQRTNRPA